MKVIRRALTAYGTWYVWGTGTWKGPTHYNPYNLGEHPDWVKKVKIGFDCSGFVAYAFGGISHGFGQSSTEVHGGTWAESAKGHSVRVDRSALLPADLLFWGMEHVALYIGRGQTLQAPGSYDYVKMKPMDSPNLLMRYVGFVK